MAAQEDQKGLHEEADSPVPPEGLTLGAGLAADCSHNFRFLGMSPNKLSKDNVEGQVLPLGHLLSILSRVLSVHELKLALELLSDWSLLPIAAVPVARADEFASLLDSFVRRRREQQVAGSGGVGLEALHAYLRHGAGDYVNYLPAPNTKNQREPVRDHIGDTENVHASSTKDLPMKKDQVYRHMVFRAGKSIRQKQFQESFAWQVEKAESLQDEAEFCDSREVDPKAKSAVLAATKDFSPQDSELFTKQITDDIGVPDDVRSEDVVYSSELQRIVQHGAGQNGLEKRDTAEVDGSFELDFAIKDSIGSKGSDVSGTSKMEVHMPALQVRADLEAFFEKHIRDAQRKKRRSRSVGHELETVGTSSLRIGSRPSTSSRESFGLDSVFSHLSEEAQEEAARRPLAERIVFRPDSMGRAIFEVFSLVVLLHDSLLLPFVLAWDPPITALLAAGQYIALVFWTTDMMLSFCTGFYHEGEVVLDLHRVVAHYLRGWFWLDFSVNLVDASGVLLENILQSSSDLRVIRRLRVIRLLGVARVMRLFPRFRELGTQSLYTNWNIFLQVVKLLCIILWINHISCCAWYGIGRIRGDTNLSWLDTVVADDMTYRTAPRTYQYFTAMHFSMTQMTPGSMQVFPVNTLERIFNVISLIFGLLFGTSLVSQISTKMIQFSLARQEYIQRMGTLRQFLRENNIPQVLATRIQKQVSDRMKVGKRLTENDVVALNSLSRALRGELRYAAFSPYIVLHPLFLAWADIASQTIRELCNLSAIHLMCMSPGKVLFAAGSKADSAFLLIRGTMNYVYENQNEDGEPNKPRTSALLQLMVGADEQKEYSSEGDDMMRPSISGEMHQDQASAGSREVQSEQVVEGSWLCEAALWTDWVHLGTLEAFTACELLSLSCAGIAKVIRAQHQVAVITQSWAHAFCRACEYSTCDIMQDHGAIISLMPEEAREQIGTTALDYLSKMRWMNRLRRGANVDLKAELDTGKCTLIIEGNGSVVRTVFVVVLRVKRSDGRFFIQFGRLETARQEKISISCQLPGAKMGSGEVPSEVVQRVLKNLAVLSDNVVLTHTSLTDEVKESLNFGIQTRYLRTIYHAKLKEECIHRWHRLQDYTGDLSQNTAESVLSNAVPITPAASARSTRASSKVKSNIFDDIEACLVKDAKDRKSVV